MKRILSVALALCLLLTLVACSTPTPAPAPADEPAASTAPADEPAQSEAPADEGTKTFKVGINNFGVANFFARIGKAAMEEELTKLGCEVVATVTADVSSRSAAIENMMSQGCDAIIIQEGDINEVATACREAKAAGIIIGSMDAGNADFVDIYVSSDNPQLGKIVAEQMVEAIGGKGRIVEIINDAGSMIRDRKDAMHEVIAGYPEIELFNSITYAWPDFYPDVKSKVESLLQANPNPGDIVAIYSTFDGGGVAACDAVREAGLEEHIVIVGVDGDPDAYAEMRKENSPFIATMAQDPDTIARVCVQNVVDLLNGKTIAQQQVHIEGILITQANIPEDQ